MTLPRLSFLASALLLPVASALAFDAATASNDLGLRLFAVAARQSRSNLVISPYSIDYGLLLAYAGAEGTTRSEMARVMGLPDDDELLLREITHQRVLVDGAIQTAVFARRSAADGQPELTVANNLFGQIGLPFRREYLDAMKDDYHAPFQQVDFVRGPERARAQINAWVSNSTDGKIAQMLAPGNLLADTQLVLANAIYFKVPWARRFDPAETVTKPFRDFGTGERDVPTMVQTNHFDYSAEHGFTAVAIPYLGSALECVILLPDAGSSPEQLLASLTAERLREAARENLMGEDPTVRLFLPKFQIAAQTRSLKDDLESLGMKSAFDEPIGSADFDRMAPNDVRHRLALGDVDHAALIDLDESGTEAAAATTAQMAVRSMVLAAEKSPIEMHVDRPFLFVIRVKDTGLCLFLGRVTNPQTK